MTKSRYILLGAGALATLYGVSYLLKLNRFSNELETVTKASIHKVTLQGIELQVDVTLKNPSGGSVRVKQPFVKMIYNNNTLVSSQMQNVNIEVPKFSEVKMEPIRLNIGFMTLATKVPALLKEYRDKGQISIVVKTITTINDKLPYTKTDNITLGSGKKA
jgi:hypothetical protein